MTPLPPEKIYVTPGDRNTHDKLLPVVQASYLDEPDDTRRWLIEPILPRAGVSICGGAPKCAKSWMGLDLALSIASQTPCLGRFDVAEPGPTLVYFAEDPQPVVRERIDGLCRHRDIDLKAIPLHIITTPLLRLDQQHDQKRLANTVRHYQPRLLVLDPFVRLHRLRENDSGDVSALLSYLRALQREHDMAILLTHHARKSGASSAQNGHGLRGSGDFYAFVDTLLYLRRRRDQLLFSIEHRAAPTPNELMLGLVSADGDTHLAVTPQSETSPLQPQLMRNLEPAILRVLKHASQPMTAQEIRAALHCRRDHLDQALQALHTAGKIVQDATGWSAQAR